jgi:quinoprotein glucose dehydrogenase
VWHSQLVHHDIWNYDTSTGPVVMNLAMNGRDVPAVAQVTKQAWVYAFNRQTGEPLWPIVERPVPASKVPGERLARTQPHPTKPAAYDMQGLPESELIDFTPALRAEALKALERFDYGPMFQPPLHVDNTLGKVAALWCPGDVGGTNIDGTPAFDPETGILYVPSQKGCTARILVSGAERDRTIARPTGTTISQFAVGGMAPIPTVRGLPIYKPPYSRITAIDMKTGDHLWWIPVGETPNQIKTNPALGGLTIPNTGTGRQAAQIVTPTLLMYAGETGDGAPHLFAVDKRTGQALGKVKVPRPVRYGMISYLHGGRQYVVVQMNGGLAALALR